MLFYGFSGIFADVFRMSFFQILPSFHDLALPFSRELCYTELFCMMIETA